MKVGDKLFCYNTIELNKKNHYYTIISLSKNRVEVTTEIDPEGTLLSFRKFYINKQIDHWSRFKDHFITLKKVRKIKLKKLNETR